MLILLSLLIRKYDFIDILLIAIIIFIIGNILYFTIYFTNLNRHIIPTNPNNICEKLYRMYDNEKYDILMRPLKFNGSKLKHWTMPFEGDRYSFIYYKN